MSTDHYLQEVNVFSFPAKLMAALVAVLFLLGDFPATSASLPYGNNSSFAITFNMRSSIL